MSAATSAAHRFGVRGVTPSQYFTAVPHAEETQGIVPLQFPPPLPSG